MGDLCARPYIAFDSVHALGSSALARHDFLARIFDLSLFHFALVLLPTNYFLRCMMCALLQPSSSGFLPCTVLLVSSASVSRALLAKHDSFCVLLSKLNVVASSLLPLFSGGSLASICAKVPLVCWCFLLPARFSGKLYCSCSCKRLSHYPRRLMGTHLFALPSQVSTLQIGGLLI